MIELVWHNAGESNGLMPPCLASPFGFSSLGPVFLLLAASLRAAVFLQYKVTEYGGHDESASLLLMAVRMSLLARRGAWDSDGARLEFKW